MYSYPLLIARRISLGEGGRKGGAAVKVASAAVALSVAVMLAAVAVVLGFKKEITDKVVGFNDHITLYSGNESGQESNVMTLTPSLASVLDGIPFIKGYSLGASIPAILKTSDDFKGVYLKGLVGNNTPEFLLSVLEQGIVPDYSKEENAGKIVVSRITADKLGLEVGEKIDTYFINDDVRVRRLEVAGIYNSHFGNYDDVLVYGPLSIVQKMGGLRDSQGISVGMSVDYPDRVEEYAGYIESALKDALAEGILYSDYRVATVKTQGAGYFRWLSLLDTNVVVVLTLMTVVACITLVSGMLIVILDKKRFIGLMKALGAPTRKIRKVFLYIALRIAITGMLIGNVCMLGFLYAQKRWHFLPLDPESYYIDFVPVDIHWAAAVLLNIAVLIVAYLVLILPSAFVARISPAETMRGE